jgi:hypothetical protein
MGVGGLGCAPSETTTESREVIRIFALARVQRLLLLVTVAFAALPGASALAFTTTIGKIGSDAALLCPGSSAFADTNYVVSSSGGNETITSFSFQSDSSNRGEQLAFLVLRPAEGNSYTVVGTTGLVTLKGSGPEPETFPPARPISVQRGDILGFWLPANLDNCGRDVTPPSGGVVASPNLPEPNTGDTITPSYSVDDFDLNEAATLVVLPPTGEPPPTSKSQCKHGGWKSFGPTFKTEGDCVSFVATRGKNPPSG